MGVVTISVLCNGSTISREYALLYLDVSHEFNRIPTAELGFIDGDAASQNYPISESEDFAPGSQVEIKLSYEGNREDKTVFKGVVVKQGLQMDNSGGMLVAEMSDEAIKMTVSRKSAVFADKKDSEVISDLISQQGLNTGTIASTELSHKKLVQYYSSNWDFMLSRAEVNGLLVSVSAGSISLARPDLSQSVKRSFDFKTDEVFEFAFEADAHRQFSAVQSIGWDVGQQALMNPVQAEVFTIEQGNFDADTFARAVGGTEEILMAGVRIDSQEAQAWADSKMMRSRLSMLRGRFRIPGTAEIEVGDVIQIDGVGRRFSGKTIVTAVRHHVSSGAWETHLQFGLDAESFATQTSIVDVKASGLLPGVNGLQIGLVSGTADPDDENRIEVKIPAIDAQSGTVWARLAMPDAGNERGLLFRPETGDEVILGFLNDDPRQAIIIGSVFSSANKAPFEADDKNPEKGIVTRSGMKLVFDDEKKSLTISTSDDNVITINEQDKFVEVKDANDNTVKLSSDGISLDSGKDVIIKSSGDIKIQASGNVEIKGSKIDVI